MFVVIFHPHIFVTISNGHKFASITDSPIHVTITNGDENVRKSRNTPTGASTNPKNFDLNKNFI